MRGFFRIVVRQGFEARQTEPKSVVLPLHHRTIHGSPCRGCKGKEQKQIAKTFFNFILQLVDIIVNKLCGQSPATPANTHVFHLRLQ